MLSFFRKIEGLNLVSPSSLLSPGECTEALNLRVNESGQFVTREGLKRITLNPCSGAVKEIRQLQIGSSKYIFLVDANFALYKCSGTEPNLNPGSPITTLDGDATLEGFNGFGVVMDGGYLLKTQGTSVALAYDDGEGTGGYHYSNLCNQNDTTKDLYSGAITKAGSTFTTTSFGSRTLPLVGLDVWLSKTGSPTGTVSAKLYNSLGDTLLSTATTTYDISTDILSNATKKRFTFPGTYGLAADTSYIIAVEFSGGDASNYLSVHGKTVSSSGDCEYWNGSTWTNDTTIDTGLGVKPGLPPKASFGTSRNLRFFLVSDDSPGRLYYSNLGSILDWSSPTNVLTTNVDYDQTGGGYVGVIDDDADNFPVGALVPFFGDLLVFGKKDQPFLTRLTGDSPYFYQLTPLFKQIETTKRAIQALKNDVWFVGHRNVYNLRGVQQYGNFETYSPGNPIKNLIEDWWDEDVFTGYDPRTNQLLIKLTGYSKVLVCHLATPTADKVGNPRYIWTHYQYKNLTPSAFGIVDGELCIGCTDGHLYKPDSSLVQDNGSAFDVTLKTGIVEFPFQPQTFSNYWFEIVSDSSATLTLSVYKNGSGTSAWDKTLTVGSLPVQDRMTLSCEALQLEFHNCSFSDPLTIAGIVLK